MLFEPCDHTHPLTVYTYEVKINVVLSYDA